MGSVKNKKVVVSDIVKEQETQKDKYIKRSSYNDWSKKQRELDPKEEQRVKQLKELKTWKTFASDPIFNVYKKLKIDFKEPRWGITGRLITDELPERFEHIPDVIKFFSDDGKAAQYLEAGLSPLDVFIIYNSNFIGLQGGRIRGRDKFGRDFFTEEHTSRGDLETIFSDKLETKILIPSVVKTEFDRIINKSFSVINDTISGYNSKNIENYMSSSYDKPLVCELTKCQNNLLSVKCCNKTICFKCILKIAETQMDKWLFIPTLVKCDANKCREGVKLPVIEDQVIDYQTYCKAIFCLQYCPECRIGYQNENEHLCDKDNRRLIGIAENIGCTATATAKVINQSRSKASEQKSHTSTSSDIIAVSLQSGNNHKKKSSIDSTDEKQKSITDTANGIEMKTSTINRYSGRNSGKTLTEIESIALKSGGVFGELWTKFEVQQSSVLELNEKTKQQTETIKQQTETIKQQMETIGRLKTELSEEKRRSETFVTEQTDLLKNKELFERFTTHLLDKQRKKIDKNFNKIFNSFSLRETVLKRQNPNEDDGTEDLQKPKRLSK